MDQEFLCYFSHVQGQTNPIQIIVSFLYFHIYIFLFGGKTLMMTDKNKLDQYSSSMYYETSAL